MNTVISIPGTDYNLEMSPMDLGSIIIITSVFIVLAVVMTLMAKFDQDPEPELEPEEIHTINFVEGQQSIDFLERLIREKYSYYMYLELLPIYLDRKIPEKNTIKKIKEKIYVSVVGSLTKSVKLEILKYFTEKGIEIFVNEKIIIMINETDFRSAEKFTEEFREITVGNVSQLI